jgi:hypothetical protein
MLVTIPATWLDNAWSRYCRDEVMDVRLEGERGNNGIQNRNKAAAKAVYAAQVACASMAGKEPWAALLTTHDGVSVKGVFVLCVREG